MTSSTSDRAPGLSRARIARMAAKLVDEDGFDRLTLRALARRLGVSAPSLYEHVASKEDLIDLVVAGILEEAAGQWHPPAAWDELIRYEARFWHRVMLEHPAVHRSVLRQPNVAPVGLDTVERFLEALTGAGMTADEALAAYLQLFGYVVGVTALVHSRSGGSTAPGTVQPAQQARVRALERVDPRRYPALVKVRIPLSELVNEQMFDTGLEALITGIRCRLASIPAASPPPGRSA